MPQGLGPALALGLSYLLGFIALAVSLTVGGSEGPPGAQGERGTQGLAGAAGAAGAQGPEGRRGEEGRAGAPGGAGPAGAQGPQGPAGPAGTAGATPTDQQLTALINSTVTLRASELRGKDGVNGRDADPNIVRQIVEQVLASNPQFRGPQGPQGVQGLKGDKGDQGNPAPYRPQAILADPSIAPNGAGSTINVYGWGFNPGASVAVILPYTLSSGQPMTTSAAAVPDQSGQFQVQLQLLQDKANCFCQVKASVLDVYLNTSTVVALATVRIA